MINKFIVVGFLWQIYLCDGNIPQVIKMNESSHHYHHHHIHNSSMMTMNLDNENCTKICYEWDDECINELIDYVTPTSTEYILIIMHVITFIVGLTGNALVCIAVYRNRAMRNVTNLYIANLAVADFMVILFCLPPTVIWDVTETWFLGNIPCKVILYFQTASVAVSVSTLTAIAYDRWEAICFPLQFTSTTARAKQIIKGIWIFSLSCDIIEFLFLEAVPNTNFCPQIYFTQCQPTWSERSEKLYQVAKVSILYLLPLSLICYYYHKIIQILWTSQNIPGHKETLKMMNTSSIYANSLNGRRIGAGNTTESQLRSRRKAAKMLVLVVIMFALCYLPVHVLSVLRSFEKLEQTDTMAALSNLFHWLCYANSAMNPIIYNFMSGKFRREFKRAFYHCSCSKNRRNEMEMTSHNGVFQQSHRRSSFHSYHHYHSSSRRTKSTSLASHT